MVFLPRRKPIQKPNGLPLECGHCRGDIMQGEATWTCECCDRIFHEDPECASLSAKRRGICDTCWEYHEG